MGTALSHYRTLGFPFSLMYLSKTYLESSAINYVSSVPCTYLVFWEQLVLCTVLMRGKNHFKNQNSCFFFQNQEALVCKPLFPHVSNAFSQQLLSYWQKCYSLNLSETLTLIRCIWWVKELLQCAPYECSGFQ